MSMNAKEDYDHYLNYHLSQWDSDKFSTLKMLEFLDENLHDLDEILDIGCGAGAATSKFAQNSKVNSITGIDTDQRLIDIAFEMKKLRKCSSNLNFEKGDAFDLEQFASRNFTGVVSLQTLSWLESHDKAMEQIYLHIRPKWIAISSLFYPGEISARIQIFEHLSGRHSYYNVISLPELDEQASSFNYRVTKIQKFELEVELPFPENIDLMQTYTRQVIEEGKIKNYQFSGPIWMPWYLILIERSNLEIT